MCKSINGIADIHIYLQRIGEDIDESEWALADARIDLDETEDEDIEAMLNTTLSVSKSLSLATARPYQDSTQDSKLIKVRYRFAKKTKRHGSSGATSRDFCRMMHASKKVYRKEDILKMQSDGLNSRMGHNQQPYSIWLHKGGVNCYDVWERVIYIKKTKKDGTPYGGKGIKGTDKSTVGQAKKKGFDPQSRKQKNNKRVAEAQIDRTDKGHHPSYVKPKKRR